MKIRFNWYSFVVGSYDFRTQVLALIVRFGSVAHFTPNTMQTGSLTVRLQYNSHFLRAHLPPIVNRVKGISECLKSILGNGSFGYPNLFFRVYRSYHDCIVDKA